LILYNVYMYYSYYIMYFHVAMFIVVCRVISLVLLWAKLERLPVLLEILVWKDCQRVLYLLYLV